MDIPAEPKLSPSDDQELLLYVESCVAAAVRATEKDPASPSEGGTLHRLPPALATLPAFGAFVTLRRGRSLRACRGQWGGEAALEELLAETAAASATSDPRFPRVSPSELPFLDIEISLMHSPQWHEGEEVLSRVEIGRHGVAIKHPEGRGLLLPQVASEAGWDADQFLSRLCGKAGLDSLAWRDPDARIMTFECQRIHRPPRSKELDDESLSVEDFDAIQSFLATGRWPGEARRSFLETRYRGEIGLLAKDRSGASLATIRCERSLSELAEELRQLFPDAARHTTRLAVLSRPIDLDPCDPPERFEGLGIAAFRATTSEGWTLAVGRAESALPQAMSAVGLEIGNWQHGLGRVTAFAIHAHEVAVRSAEDEIVRSPAVAGTFYPADPKAIARAIEHDVATAKPGVAKCRAVLLPHAGWRYCGPVIGATLAGMAVPDRVILIGPNHTGQGPGWSVSAAGRWRLPTGEVPVDTSLVQELVRAAPGLARDSDAHRSEHAIEVLLPWLLWRNSALSVVPIAMKRTAPEDIEPLAAALAQVLSLADPPLVVISSDLNHFAPEPENRRLDQLAIDALTTGDPRQVWEVVREHRITMCGVVPAVTVLRALELTGGATGSLAAYDNSGTTSGDTDRVVGYAGIHFA